MSTEVSYRRIPMKTIEQLYSDPVAADHFFGWDLDEEDEDAQDAYYSALKSSSSYLSVGKWWHALNFLLTSNSALDNISTPHPLGEIVFGGADTEWNSSYGRIKYLTQEKVTEVAAALNLLPDEMLLSRLNATEFRSANIYPGGPIWNNSTLAKVWAVYNQVREFFTRAAQDNEIILISQD